MKKTVVPTILIIFLSFVFIGCNKQTEDRPSHSVRLLSSDRESFAPSYAMQAANPSSPSPEQLVLQQRMVIKTAAITCEVESYDRADSAIQKLVAQNNGYVVSSSLTSAEERKKTGSITIRVPSALVDETLGEIGKVSSKILNQSISGNDVTEDYFDVAMRVENRRKVESRYREILKSAKTVRDILEVEKSLGSIREEIDRLEGRKRFLENQTALSTITAHLQEPQAIGMDEGGGFWNKIERGFRDGVRGFADVLGFCITVLIAAVPAITVIALIVLFAVKLVRALRPATASPGRKDSKK